MENNANNPKMKPLSMEDLEKVDGGNSVAHADRSICTNGREHIWEWDSTVNAFMCIRCAVFKKDTEMS